MQLRKALIALGIGTLTAVGLAIPAATTASATEPRPCDSQEHRTDKTCPPSMPKHRPPDKSKSPKPDMTSKSPKPKPTETSKKPTKPTETSKKPTKPTEAPTTTAPARLPTTGDATSLPLLAGVGAALVIVGGVLVGMRRRRDATDQ